MNYEINPSRGIVDAWCYSCGSRDKPIIRYLSYRGEYMSHSDILNFDICLKCAQAPLQEEKMNTLTIEKILHHVEKLQNDILAEKSRTRREFPRASNHGFFLATCCIREFILTGQDPNE